MNPEEKAQDLYDKIMNNGGCCMCPGDTIGAIEVFCNEMIEMRGMPDAEYLGTDTNKTLIGGIKYWEEVKNKLSGINK